jgi:PEGA domain
MSNSKLLRDLILRIVNSEASKSSPAAAAQSAQDGHAGTSQEMARLIEKGQASKTEIITSPAGAEVYIDGNKAGATPLELVLIKRDSPRTLTIKLPGYKTVEKTLVPDGENILIAVFLERE